MRSASSSVSLPRHLDLLMIRALLDSTSSSSSMNSIFFARPTRVAVSSWIPLFSRGATRCIFYPTMSYVLATTAVISSIRLPGMATASVVSPDEGQPAAGVAARTEVQVVVESSRSAEHLSKNVVLDRSDSEREIKSPVLALPGLGDEQAGAHRDTSTTTPAPTVLEVNGERITLDSLGPVILNEDGTLARITNWHEMMEHEQTSTLRIIAKRNAKRRQKLLQQQEQQNNAQTKMQPQVQIDSQTKAQDEKERNTTMATSADL
ncbi:unnamed protein product [Amoebophrya sp. A120]|nr:unnamed protein product [Amoebophrya sp. A120]|eukprot:GSA120T00015152001.1